jgi:hypothetical protein
LATAINPEILRALDELAPETELLDLIDEAVFRNPSIPPTSWEGNAGELYTQLVGEASPVQYQARKLLSHSSVCGRYLGRLTKKRHFPQGGSRVRARVKDGKTLYEIERP